MSELVEIAKQARAWACYDCGKCTGVCPIARAGASYSPRRHVLATNLGRRDELTANGTLSSCLTCSLCDRRCPAQVDYTGLVQKLRELTYRADVQPQCPHGGALQALMRMMAQGGTQQNRPGWLTDDLKTERTTGEAFYWTGCTMYYDAFFADLQLATVNANRAAVRLMNRLGVTPVVSPDERCCGHDLLWNGDRANFELLARHNVKLVIDSGAKTLVTSCAECLRTWKVDYQPFLGGSVPRIVHISEYLAERLGDLRLNGKARSHEGAAGRGEIQNPKSEIQNVNVSARRRVTFQDPCRLGRHLGIYDPPRKLLAALPGVELVEMRRSRDAAQCCAGGTWSHCDRFAKRIQVERLREARGTGAEVLLTACPKCQIHFRCAMKDPKLGGDLEITMRDVAELVVDACAEAES